MPVRGTVGLVSTAQGAEAIGEVELEADAALYARAFYVAGTVYALSVLIGDNSGVDIGQAAPPSRIVSQAVEALSTISVTGAFIFELWEAFWRGDGCDAVVVAAVCACRAIGI